LIKRKIHPQRTIQEIILKILKILDKKNNPSTTNKSKNNSQNS